MSKVLMVSWQEGPGDRPHRQVFVDEMQAAMVAHALREQGHRVEVDDITPGRVVIPVRFAS